MRYIVGSNITVTRTSFIRHLKLYFFQDISKCCSGLLRSEYGSNIVSDFVAAVGFKNNNPLGNLLPSFNTGFDSPWSPLCPTVNDSILAYIWIAITSYNCHSSHGLLVFNSFHSLAVLMILKKYSNEDNIPVVQCLQ